jgi:integrase
MAQVNFYLKAGIASDLKRILISIHFSGKRVLCKTGEKATKENLMISLLGDSDFKDCNPMLKKENKRLRERLNFLKDCADRTQKHFTDIEKKVPEKERDIQNKFYEIAGLLATEPTNEPEKETLISFITKVIREANTRQNDRTGKPISGNTIKVYNQCLRLVTEFNKTKRRIDFQNIDLDFFQDFKEFMLAKGYSQNTIAKHFITLKSFLNEATERGINANYSYKSKRFRVPQVPTDTIYLDSIELNSMYEIDLSKEPKLDRVRDLFLVGCYTGLRFSDFSNIGPENLKGDFFEITTQKTNETIIIPIHPKLRPIMAKYVGKYPNSLPPAISNQKMNEYLKEIGKRIEGLNENINVVSTQGILKVNKTFQKFEKISTHTARRSFATNLYKEGFPPQGIMKITGHRTEKAFLKYIRITPSENAEILKLHWAKLSNLKVS